MAKPMGHHCEHHCSKNNCLQLCPRRGATGDTGPAGATGVAGVTGPAGDTGPAAFAEQRVTIYQGAANTTTLGFMRAAGGIFIDSGPNDNFVVSWSLPYTITRVEAHFSAAPGSDGGVITMEVLDETGTIVYPGVVSPGVMPASATREQTYIVYTLTPPLPPFTPFTVRLNNSVLFDPSRQHFTQIFVVYEP